MTDLFKKNSWFYIPYLIFILIIGIILVSHHKNDIHIYINQFHCSFADFYFKYITHLGDGVTIGAFVAILLFIKYRYALAMLIITLSTTIVVQSFKRFITPDVDRPKRALGGIADIYLVEGVDVHTSHSFPSGHTTSGFCIFLMLALMVKNKAIKIFAFILALSVGFSRVYLSQHFINDIYFGSLIAVLITTFVYFWSTKWKNEKFNLNLLNNKLNKNNVSK